MAGGAWSSENKVLPGVYIRFRGSSGLSLNPGMRGVVTICEPLSWGPVGVVQELSAGADTTPMTGYAMTDPKNLFLQEIFKGSNRTAAPVSVLLYRPAASGSASAAVTVGTLTATAKHPGLRGNDISLVISALLEPANAFQVDTVVDGVVVDSQTAAAIAELVANDWVGFSGTGSLTATAGAPLIGGLDGDVLAAAYATYLAAIEAYKFDVLVYDGADDTVKASMVSFVNRLANDLGSYTQLVAANLTTPNTQYAVNVTSGVTLADGTTLTPAQTCWWAGGATAGAAYNQSLTFASYPGAVSATPIRTQYEQQQALEAGQFILFADGGAVQVMQDINSLVSAPPELNDSFKKNRVLRTLSTIANDVYTQFSANYIGAVSNNDEGRTLFRSAIIGYLAQIQANEGIQNFAAEDVTVRAGAAIDAILVDVAIQPVDSVEKIYMTIQVA